MNGGGGLPVIACELGALSPPERQRRAELADALKSAIVNVTDLPSGYEIHVGGDAVIATEVHEFVALERRCCPFLTLQIATDPASGRMIVTITGGPGVKEFIAAQFGAKEVP